MTPKALTVRGRGLNLYVEDAGVGEPALVFLHAWGSSGRAWAEVIDRLADRYRCITVDLRGWGRSDRPEDDNSLFSQADDVACVIAALGLQRHVLVGHAMGGKVALIAASRAPAGLEGLVLVAPAPPSPFASPPNKREGLLERYSSAERVEESMSYLAHRPLSDTQRRQTVDDVMAGGEAAKRAWVNQGMDLDITALAAAISVPISVIIGSADRLVREATLREAFRVIPGVRFEMLEGVGHLAPLEAPGSIAEAISDFLAH